MSHNKQLRQRRQFRRRPENLPNFQLYEFLNRNFHLWTQTLRTTPTFQFDQDEQKRHRCKMFFAVFPHLQSVGNRGKTKQEAKCNAIIAFLAHLEKRRQVGLFVPYLTPNLVHYVQREIRMAEIPLPDMNLNENEYLLAERIVQMSDEKKIRPVIKILEDICQVRSVFLFHSNTMVFLYVVGGKTQKTNVDFYFKTIFQAEHEQLFNYGNRLAHIFRDGKFIREVCQRLRVICEQNLDENHLSIRGTRENVSKCYDEFVTLRREFENQVDKTKRPVPLRVNVVRQTKNEISSEEKLRRNPSPPIVIELSDDSNDGEKTETKLFNLPPPPEIRPNVRPMPQATTKVLRHIVLDGQNVGRNSNDFKGTFSWIRLSNAIQFFKNRGHQHIIAFLPLYYRDQIETSAMDSNETRVRDELIQSQLIVFTPSRYNNGKRLTNYDDRFILQYAADNDGIVVSNDNFRDLQHEIAFQNIIRHRILPFATVNNTFMPASDPLGRNGPNLDQFLCKNEVSR